MKKWLVLFLALFAFFSVPPAFAYNVYFTNAVRGSGTIDGNTFTSTTTNSSYEWTGFAPLDDGISYPDLSASQYAFGASHNCGAGQGGGGYSGGFWYYSLPTDMSSTNCPSGLRTWVAVLSLYSGGDFYVERYFIFYNTGTYASPVWHLIPQQFLGFPLQYNSWTPDTANIASIFDHSMNGAYSTNDTVVAYNGETGSVNAHTATGCGTSWSKTTGNDEAFVINGHYVGDSTCGEEFYLTYDGHPGYDYLVPHNTPVYASADGTIDGTTGTPVTMDCPANGSSCGGYGRVGIRHANGYSSWYLHLDHLAIPDEGEHPDGWVIGETIHKGDLLGYSGDTIPYPYSVGYHLHFEVRNGSANFYGTPVDPYGWTGGGSDPYTAYMNTRLWE